MSSDTWQGPDEAQPSAPGAEEPTGPLPKRPLLLTAVFIGVVALGLLTAWVLGSGAPAAATIGADAPDFEVLNIEGNEPIVLSDLVSREDRPIVINLMASWCGPCRAEIPEISSFADANPDVFVLGVAVEDVYADFKQFVSELRPTYTVAFDEGAMREAYPSLGLPATFILDEEGTIVDIFNGILDQPTLEELIAGID